MRVRAVELDSSSPVYESFWIDPYLPYSDVFHPVITGCFRLEIYRAFIRELPGSPRPMYGMYPSYTKCTVISRTKWMTGTKVVL
jgi:hypothetical protein